MSHRKTHALRCVAARLAAQWQGMQPPAEIATTARLARLEDGPAEAQPPATVRLRSRAGQVAVTARPMPARSGPLTERPYFPVCSRMTRAQ